MLQRNIRMYHVSIKTYRFPALVLQKYIRYCKQCPSLHCPSIFPSHPVATPGSMGCQAEPKKARPWDGTPNSAQLGPVLGRNQRILYTDRHRPRFMAPSNATMTLVPNAVKLSAVVAAQYPTAPCSVKHIHEST